MSRPLIPHLAHAYLIRTVQIRPITSAEDSVAHVTVSCNGEVGDRVPFETLLDARNAARLVAEALGCEIRDHTDNQIT